MTDEYDWRFPYGRYGCCMSYASYEVMWVKRRKGAEVARGKCEQCKRDKFANGDLLEIQPCSCGMQVCMSCFFSKHQHEEKAEYGKKAEKNLDAQRRTNGGKKHRPTGGATTSDAGRRKNAEGDSSGKDEPAPRQPGTRGTTQHDSMRGNDSVDEPAVEPADDGDEGEILW